MLIYFLNFFVFGKSNKIDKPTITQLQHIFLYERPKLVNYNIQASSINHQTQQV